MGSRRCQKTDTLHSSRAVTKVSVVSITTFHFWLATYGDMLFSDEANAEAYNFWYGYSVSEHRDILTVV